MLEVRVCIDVRDLDEGIRFYTRAFELTVGRRESKNWAELLGANIVIDVLGEQANSSAVPNASAPRTYERHWTPVHLDFVVTNLDEAIRRLQDAGATMDREVQERDWGRMANMADPFGNGLCLLELSNRGYDALTSPP